MSADERAALLRAYVGDARATAGTSRAARSSARSYRFDVLADYGAFRDLQRHRLLTLEWQPLSTRHGYTEPAAIEEAGALADWREVMDASAELYEQLVGAGLRDVAPYAVVMAYRVRFYMDMNAREAMHVIELRTAPQGHPSYRRVCQLMHRAIATSPATRAIAAAMQFADHSDVELERLQSERSLEEEARSIHGLAAADVVGLPGDRRRAGRRQKLHEVRDFLGLDDPLDRHGAERLRLELLERHAHRRRARLHALRGHVGVDPAGADRVHRDAAPASSSASARVKPITACFDAQYAV